MCTGRDNHVTTITTDKCFHLADTGQRVMEENVKREASSGVIPTGWLIWWYTICKYLYLI
jgi:hypothetical protein